jgi:hypothetical protein
MFPTVLDNDEVTSDDELFDLVGQVHGVVCSAMEKLLRAVYELDRREAYRVDGCRTMASWLQLRLGLAAQTAHEWVRVARQLHEMPTVAATFEAGHLSWDQLQAVTSLVAEAGLDEADTALDAVGKTAAELERLAREARRVSAEEAEAKKRDESVRMRYDRQGMLRLHGRLADERGVAVKQAVERLADSLPDRRPDGTLVPWDERCADALVLLAGVRIADDADPDRATVVVHAELDLLTGEPTGLAQLEMGTVLSHETLERILCDCRFEISLDDLLGRTVEKTKVKYTVPRWLRRKILHRDGGCRWPGCGRTGMLHAHHMVHFPKGATEEQNLLCLCWFHHRVLHEGGWRAEGDPAVEVRFVDRTGRVLSTGPPGLRPEVRHRLDGMLGFDAATPAV